MNPLEVLAPVIIVLLACGWQLSWLASRLDRAHARVERTWAVLDATLARRAERALELCGTPEVDPEEVLPVQRAATRALSHGSQEQRESAESELTLALVRSNFEGFDREQEHVSLARRLHNDAVTTAAALRRSRIVRIAHLAGHAPEFQPFEMADEVAGRVTSTGPH